MKPTTKNHTTQSYRQGMLDYLTTGKTTDLTVAMVQAFRQIIEHDSMCYFSAFKHFFLAALDTDDPKAAEQWLVDRGVPERLVSARGTANDRSDIRNYQPKEGDCTLVRDFFSRRMEREGYRESSIDNFRHDFNDFFGGTECKIHFEFTPLNIPNMYVINVVGRTTKALHAYAIEFSDDSVIATSVLLTRGKRGYSAEYNRHMFNWDK
jgi:hypothetical protein